MREDLLSICGTDHIFLQANVQHWVGHPNFQLIVHDVVQPILLEVGRRE